MEEYKLLNAMLQCNHFSDQMPRVSSLLVGQ